MWGVLAAGAAPRKGSRPSTEEQEAAAALMGLAQAQEAIARWVALAEDRAEATRRPLLLVLLEGSQETRSGSRVLSVLRVLQGRSAEAAAAMEETARACRAAAAEAAAGRQLVRLRAAREVMGARMAAAAEAAETASLARAETVEQAESAKSMCMRGRRYPGHCLLFGKCELVSFAVG